MPVPPAPGPLALLRGAAELGEPRRLSVRGGAVPGRTLEPEGLPVPQNTKYASLPRTHSRSTCSGPLGTLRGAAELGEPRRLSVRGGAVPGRTLEPEGLPSSAKQEVREPRAHAQFTMGHTHLLMT